MTRGLTLTEGSDLGVVLRLLREWQAWTQEDLARRTGISRVQIGKLEREEIDRPQIYTFQRLRWGLGLRPDSVARIAARWRVGIATTHRDLERATVLEARGREGRPASSEIFGAYP